MPTAVVATVEFAVGDEVLLDTRNLRMTGSKKLRQRWVGPFVVERFGGTSSM